MPDSGRGADLQSMLSIDDLDAARAIELRKTIHCSESSREEAGKLLDNFGAIEKKLSSGSKAECRRGVLCWIIGQTGEAIRLLESVRASKERNSVLGLAYLESGMPSKASDCLAEAYQSDPGDPTLALLRADCLIKMGDTENAERDIAKVLKKDDKNAEAHYLLGCCRERQGLRDEAMKFFEQATTIDPAHAPSIFRIAFFTDLAGEDEKAQEMYEQLAAMKPRHANTLVNLGLIYEDKGDYDKAIHCYQAVVDEHPTHRRARLYLSDAVAAKTMYYDEEASRREERMNMIFSTNVNELNFSTRVREGLTKANISSIGELTKKTEEELLNIPNFGRTSLNEVKDGLRTKGLTLYKDAESQALLSQVSSQVTEEVRAKSLTDFEWSGRIRKVFERLNITTVGDLLQRTEAELLKQPNLGMTSVKEIRKKLSTIGVNLQPE